MFWVLKRTVSECSKEPSHRDGSFETPQHNMFRLRNKKIIFLLRTLKVVPDSPAYVQKITIF